MNININILIPNTKESQRLPDKNRFLRNYTLDWLESELPRTEAELKNKYFMLHKPITIKLNVIELRNSRVPVDTSQDSNYSFTITPIFCPDEVSHDMSNLLGWYEQNHKSDYNILLQLTQPKRRAGLLSEVIIQSLKYDTYLTTSYCKLYFNDAWRVINQVSETWNEQKRGTDEANYIKLYDGAIYAWATYPTGCKLLWQHDRPKNLIENYKGQPVDIDYLEDYTQFLKDLNKI